MGEQIINEFSKANAAQCVLLRYFNPVGAHPSIMIGELPIGKPANLRTRHHQTAIGKLPLMQVYGDRLRYPRWILRTRFHPCKRYRPCPHTGHSIPGTGQKHQTL